jgi:NitT/TauT family transport system substrate-binding protein
MTVRHTSVFTMVLMVLVIIAATLGWWQTRTHQDPLRIGLNAWPGYEFLYLAQERGFYQDAGVLVQLVEFSSLSDARRAYERGQIDGLGTTVIEVLQAHQVTNRTLQVVDVVDYSDGADEVLVRQGRKDLRGARIGVELGSLGIYVLVRALESQGLTLSDTTVLNLDQLSMQEAFHAGEIDALVTYPPMSLSIKNTKKTTSLYSSANIPGEVVDVIAIDAAVVAERTEDVRRLLSAFHRAKVFAEREPAIALPIMAAREGITPAEFAATLQDGIKLVSAREQADFLRPGGKIAKVMDTADRIMRSAGQLSGPDRRQGSYTDRFVQTTTP